MSSDAINPYVGLRPFNINESLLFFGRNNQTMELLQRLHLHHFLAIVGGSGSGKSSLVRAGLIPALKAGYLVQDSDNWFIAIMKPGQRPLYNLAEAILQQVYRTVDEDTVKALLLNIEESGVEAILNVLELYKKAQNSNFFLLVDQFEELFRFAMENNDVAKTDEAIDFVNIVLELSQQNNIPFYVVLTMRSDFIGDCAEFFGLPEALNQSQYLVPKLNRFQLKTVIEGPAKLYGSAINASLTSKLLNDLDTVRDELPLLQHVLMRIWDFEVNLDKSGELDIEDYANVGGIKKALSNHADEALVGMTEVELQHTKKIFQALTTIDENGRHIRRPVLLSELVALTDIDKIEILKIIDLFIQDKRSFLIKSKVGNDVVIDISHESLIRQWTTLKRWADEEGDAASCYVQLAEARNLYNQKKKDVLSGSELQIALEWRRNFKPKAAWANRYREGFQETMAYLDASEMERERLNKIENKRKKNKRIMIITMMIMMVIISIISISNWQILKGQKLHLEVKKVQLESQKKKLENLNLELENNQTGLIENSIKLDSIAQSSIALLSNNVTSPMAMKQVRALKKSLIDVQISKLAQSALSELALTLVDTEGFLVLEKVLPYKTEQSIIVVPQVIQKIRSEENPYTYKLKIHILLIDNMTSKILGQYTQDYITDSQFSLQLDTAHYYINKQLRAFGVRFIESSKIAKNEKLSLFLAEPKKKELKKILDNYMVYQYEVKLGDGCPMKIFKSKILSMRNKTSNSYKDIRVTTTILRKPLKNKATCKTGKVTKSTNLKYDGNVYRESF